MKRPTTCDAGAERTGATRFRVANLALPAIISIAALNAVLVVGWQVIDPTDAAWIWGDPLESYIGWTFYRDEPRWNFPPLWAYGIGYPIGVSVAYLDTVPLAAVAFRLIESVLPSSFQYLGLLFLIGSVLQAYFGYKLFSKLFSGDAWLAAMGAGFLVLAPVLLFRAQAHFTLTQQWLIVAALYFYFGDRIRAGPARYLLPFAILLFLAGGIHPYFLLMIALIAFTAVGRLILEHRTTIPCACVAALGLTAVSVATLVVFGYLSPGASTTASPYGTNSMNLLALIDPQGFDSLLLPKLSIGASQYEGYSYLGLGLIVLLGIGVAGAVRRGTGRGKPVLGPTTLPLAILCLVCLGLAILPTVTLGSWRLFTIPLPEAVLKALSPFQASGRLFWPAYYLLAVAALVLVRRQMSRQWALTLIAGMLVVQAVDVSSLHSSIRSRLSAETSQLQDHDWRTLGEAHTHLVVVPAFQCNRETTPGGNAGFGTFGRLAIEQHMTINSYYAARTTDQARGYFCDQLPKQILSSGLAEDTAYVFSPAFLNALIAAEQITQHFCREADGFVLCTRDSRRAGLADGLLQRHFPPTVLDQDLLFGRQASLGLVLGEGWSFGEDGGRWTEATEASLSFRLANTPTVPLAVAMKVRAFAPNSLPVRRVRVVIDGTKVADWSFTTDAAEVRMFAIPPSAISSSRTVTVHFEMPDARRPIDLGVGSDTRLLGLHAASLRVIKAE